MNNDLTQRVQLILNKVEQLKVKKIEDETNIKRYEEELSDCENKLKDLGYNNIEEADKAIKRLEENLIKECTEIESKLNLLNF